MIDLTVEDVEGPEEVSVGDPMAASTSSMQINKEETGARDAQHLPGRTQSNEQSTEEDIVMIENDGAEQQRAVNEFVENSNVIPPDLERDEGGEGVSPALSYLTLDAQQDREDPPSAEVCLPSAAVASQYTRDRSASSSDDSSSENSEDDRDLSELNHGRPLLPRAASVGGIESLATRLLHGTASVDDVMAGASEEHRRRMEGFLAQRSNPGVEADVTRKRNIVSSQDGPRRRGLGSNSQLSAKDRTVVSASRDSSSNSRTLEGQDDDDGYSVIVPKAPLAKGRRLFIPPDGELPITAVYMRGDVQFIDQRTRCVFVKIWVERAGMRL